MPEVVACPACRRPLNAPARVLGATVQCPACGRSFTAIAAEKPASAEGAGVRANKPRDDPPTSPASWEAERLYSEFRLADAQAWRRVRRGICLLLYSVCALFPTGLGLALAAAFNSPAEGAPRALCCGAGLSFLFLHLILAWAGQVGCTTAPRRDGVRTWATLGLWTYAGLFGIVLILFWMEWVGGSWGRLIEALGGYNGPVRPGRFTAKLLDPHVMVAASLLLLGLLLTIGWFSFFTLFLRAVAGAMHARGLVRALSFWLIAACVLAGNVLLLIGALWWWNQPFPPPSSDLFTNSLFTVLMVHVLLAFGMALWFLISAVLVDSRIIEYLEANNLQLRTRSGLN